MTLNQDLGTVGKTGDARAIIAQHMDCSYLVETVSRLARVPTDVPLGFQTLMEPDDPKLVHYVQDIVRPELVRLGFYDLLDVPRNNLVVRIGRGESEQTLLIQNYTATQHHNLMDEPFSGKVATPVEWGGEEPAVFGQGVSQNKGHQAAMLTVLKLLAESGIELRGRLFWAINNEARSSHACSEAIISALDKKPTFGIIQLGTSLRISLGNRGRVDIEVHVQGKAAHSSRPDLAISAIDGAAEVVNRLKRLSWPDRHPILGGRHAIVYKIQYEPVAPHTLPSDAYLTIDRRLLPGDDPDQAVEEVRTAIGDLPPYQLSFKRGTFMLPALVDENSPWLGELQAANVAVRGQKAETLYGQGTFDAGGPCALGVPTIMYGASGGIYPTGVDFVPISAVETEARVLAHLILARLT